MQLKFILNLLFLCSLYVSSILLFTGGFLLRRLVIKDKNQCGSSPVSSMPFCHQEKIVDKLVIIIIDALRYDFLLYNSSNHQPLAFQNNFFSIHELLCKNSSNSRLFRFVADPPTTTLQRLKGLTTGSLPTFVDAGNNFMTDKIIEDNLIDQMISQKLSTFFVGDDTWNSLFPNRFNFSFPLPSFNVKDLDTVDDTVIDNILKEFKKKEKADIIIGHLLGVDHCGHTFGPYHPRMKSKLNQMDLFIKKIVELIDDKSLLLLLGDHGMTNSGDHGGDSQSELNAALFFYSKKPLFLSRTRSYYENDHPVSQVDLVPTISFLLNIPIPFQNLGILIPDFFLFSTSQNLNINSELNYLKKLNLNCKQVYKYVEKYLTITSINPHLAQLNGQFMMIQSEYNLFLKSDSNNIGKMRKLIKNHQKFIESLREKLRESWARFDFKRMIAGKATFVSTLLLNLVFMKDLNFMFSFSQLFFLFTFLFIYLFTIFFHSAISLFLSFVSFIFFFVFSVLNLFKSILILKFPYFSSFILLFSLIFWFIYCFSLFSNSYIVYEHFVLKFFLVTLFFIRLLVYLRRTVVTVLKSLKTSRITFSSTYFFNPIVVSMLLFTFLWLSSFFYICREEQKECKEFCLVNTTLSSFSNLSQNEISFVFIKFFLSILSLIFILFSFLNSLKKTGNLKGLSPAVVISSFFFPILFLLVISYWCLTIFLQPQPHFISVAMKVAKMFYTIFLLSLIILFFFPLTLNKLKYDKTSKTAKLKNIFETFIPENRNLKSIVPEIFQIMKYNWNDQILSSIPPNIQSDLQVSEPIHNEIEKIPTIYLYGLHSVYSSSVKIFFFLFISLISLLLDISLTPALLLLLLILYLFSKLNSLYLKENLNPPCKGFFNFYVIFFFYFYKKLSHLFLNKIKPILINCSDNFFTIYKKLFINLGIDFGIIIILLFLSSHHFYSFSHHPTISNIKWNAAFIGFQENDVIYSIAVILILLNTFSSNIICVLFSPLLVYLPFSSNNNSLENKKKEQETRGELFLNENKDLFFSLLIKLKLKIIFFLALKVFFLMIVVTVHRRHLMVWKIFAPRYIYEVVGFLVSCFFCLFSFLISIRTNTSINSFISNLHSD